jgi:cytochrome c-type biogenesis protein CcmH/NrfG
LGLRVTITPKRTSLDFARNFVPETPFPLKSPRFQMKKHIAFLFIAVAFVAGVVVGVIATVYNEEKAPPAILPMGKPPAAEAPAALTPEMKSQIAALQEIVKKDPKNAKAAIELGNIYFDANQPDNAIDAYSRALALEPGNADVRTDMGIMYRRKGQFDKAVAEFTKAAEADPKHVNSRYNLGVVLLHDKGDIKGAVKAWEDYLRVDSGSPRAENIRVQLEKMRGMAK